MASVCKRWSGQAVDTHITIPTQRAKESPWRSEVLLGSVLSSLLEPEESPWRSEVSMFCSLLDVTLDAAPGVCWRGGPLGLSSTIWLKCGSSTSTEALNGDFRGRSRRSFDSGLVHNHFKSSRTLRSRSRRCDARPMCTQ